MYYKLHNLATFYLLQITVYGAYLYDAVMLYAQALDEVLKENGSFVDGTAIINKIRNRPYKSNLLYQFITRLNVYNLCNIHSCNSVT